MRIINHRYHIEHCKIIEFDHKSFETNIIKYDAYLNMEHKVEYLASILNNDINSRRAICYADGVENPSCLTSIQFLIESKCLYVVCNFRSQHHELGRPNDELMINYLVTKFSNKLNHNISNVIITCNVADYHQY